MTAPLIRLPAVSELCLPAGLVHRRRASLAHLSVPFRLSRTAASGLTRGSALLALSVTGASLIYLSLAASPLVFGLSLALSWIVLRPSLGAANATSGRAAPTAAGDDAAPCQGQPRRRRHAR